MMKSKLFFLFSLACLILDKAVAQNPYTRSLDFESSLTAPLLPKGQEKEAYKYAVKLFDKDSLEDAGELFDRIYRHDSASELGRLALDYRTKIENIAIERVNSNLNRTWNWSASGTNWGMTDSPSKSKMSRQIQLDGKTIKFFRNDTLVRQTGYSIKHVFVWVIGSLTSYVQYEDTKEEWYFHLISLRNFTSDRLWIEEKSKYVCGNYGESYYICQN